LAFASDLGIIRFFDPVGGGGYAGWTADYSLLGDGIYKIALGYGGEESYGHDGEELLYVTTSNRFRTVYGAFRESDALYFESGMSGGPLFSRTGESDLTITGVIVSGSDEPISGGIRALNPAAVRLIRRYGR
jgi:hypothetical protein